MYQTYANAEAAAEPVWKLADHMTNILPSHRILQ